ncbi:MAG TPA: hypothetical protein VFG23_03585 [Polyangia bacterium]|nr:hypothetical protein [Polyangia bacterium]
MSMPRVQNPIALLFVVASMSACIIPVAPEFQDPTASPNYAPYVTSFSPDFDSIVTSQMPSFSVTFTDPNVGDDLHVRWLADYPSTTGNYRTLVEDFIYVHSADGQPQQPTDTRSVDCTVDNLAMTSDGQHRIEAIIADREFAPPSDGKLDGVDPPGLVARAAWILQITCPSQ